MNKQQIVFTAAAALAALSMSACSSEIVGHPLAATTTVTVDSGDPVADTVPATPTVTPPPAPTYLDVTGQGAVQRDHQQLQFGSPAPGVKFAYLDNTSTTGKDKCTIGPAVTAGARAGFVIAGHCANGNPQKWAQTNFDGSDPLLLGTPELVSVDTYTDDSAVIWTSEAAGDDRIAGTWPVAGVMPLEELAILPAGTSICVDGAVSGVKCTELVKVDGTRIISSPMTEQGDSGAVVFVVDAATHRATLLGVVRGGVDGDTPGADDVATALAPALVRMGATAITAAP